MAGRRPPSEVVKKATAVAGVVGPAQLALVIVILGTVRPEFDPWVQSISELAVGPNGWVLRCSYLLCGLMELALARYVRSFAPRNAAGSGGARWLRADRLLTVAALSLIALSVFPSYLHRAPVPATLHIAFFGLAALALLSLCALLPVSLPGFGGTWFRTYSRLTAVSVACIFLLLITCGGLYTLHLDAPFLSIVGGIERLGVGLMLLWLALLAACMAG